MRISDWSSDVCSSDLCAPVAQKVDRGACDHIADRRARKKAEFRERADFARQFHTLSEIGLDGIDRNRGEARRERLRAVAKEVRSEERRVAKECVSTRRARWSPEH